MSEFKLDEIMLEVIPVENGITGELECYELTKEQYEWFLVEASKKQELEKRVQELEETCNTSIYIQRMLRKENRRYKQALESIKKPTSENDSTYALSRIALRALKGDSNG